MQGPATRTGTNNLVKLEVLYIWSYIRNAHSFNTTQKYIKKFKTSVFFFDFYKSKNSCFYNCLIVRFPIFRKCLFHKLRHLEIYKFSTSCREPLQGRAIYAPPLINHYKSLCRKPYIPLLSTYPDSI